MTLRSIHWGTGLRAVLPTDGERAARTLVESRLGRSLTDGEWERVHGRLVEFVAILRDWEQDAETSALDLGKVA